MVSKAIMAALDRQREYDEWRLACEVASIGTLARLQRCWYDQGERRARAMARRVIERAVAYGGYA